MSFPKVRNCTLPWAEGNLGAGVGCRQPGRAGSGGRVMAQETEKDTKT